jgi:Arc/MetJ-type ribon-helix-helix transcriptional regulator
MRQTPTFSMSRRMVQAIAQVAGGRGESMSAVVREAVRAYISLDDDDRPLGQTAGFLGISPVQPSDVRSE